MNEEIDARLTIEPPPARRIAGTTCLATSAGPMILMSSMGLHSSGVASIPFRMKIAALFTRTWIAPKAATASAAICATLASSDTSSAHEDCLSASLPDLQGGGAASRFVAFGDYDGGGPLPRQREPRWPGQSPHPPVMTATFFCRRFMVVSSRGESEEISNPKY